MKEQYIKQVEKELNLSRKAKTEVVRDLNEIFASATEHGETEQQVIERLGTPKEFADSTAEQFGIDNSAPQKRKGIISSVTSLVVAVVAFVIYATTKSDKVPDGAIGQADAMTNIQVECLWEPDKKGKRRTPDLLLVQFAEPADKPDRPVAGRNQQRDLSV